MNSIYENTCSWIEYLVGTINKLIQDLLNPVLTFKFTFHPSNDIINDEFQQKLSKFFNEFIGLLSFDDFQLHLLKVFSFIFISIVALIFITWHVYGPRISEQFMESKPVSEDVDYSFGD